MLGSKHDVFIADDLQLKFLFKQSLPADHSIFVWHPQPSTASLPRAKLLDIYRGIGVSNVSESVRKEEVIEWDQDKLQVVLPQEKGTLIRKGLLTLILGFLAHPSSTAGLMEAGQRQEAVKGLLTSEVFEVESPTTLRYELLMFSGETKSVEASEMIRWDRKDSKLLVQKMIKGTHDGHKSRIEYATIFAKVISEGVLREKEELVDGLSQLIKLAFLLDFDEEAVGYLMRSNNLQIFMEDEEFPSSAF